MSQTWIRGPICGVDNCPSRLYTLSDGQKFCQYGHVLEGDMEIDNDHDGEFTQTRRLRFQVSETGDLVHKDRVEVEHTNKKLPQKQAKELYLRLLQTLLQKQVDLTVKVHYNDDPVFKKRLRVVVKGNWIKVLDSYLKNDSLNGSDDIPRFSINASTKLPNLWDNVLIIHHSIVQLNYYPIYLVDFFHLLITNDLPFVKTLGLFPPDAVMKLPTQFYAGLQTSVTEASFLTKVRGLERNLQLSPIDIDPNYYYAYIFKIFSQTLKLPNSIELVHMTYKLIETTELKLQHPYAEYLATDGLIVPDIIVTAAIIFITKVHFIYLNDRIDFEEWLKYLHENDAADFISGEQETSPYDLIKWTDSKISEYADFVSTLHNNGAKTKARTMQNDIMMERLLQIFQLDSRDNEPPIEAVPTRPVNFDNASIRRCTAKDVFVIEDQLFHYFSKRLNCKLPTIYRHYVALEKVVLKFLAANY